MARRRPRSTSVPPVASPWSPAPGPGRQNNAPAAAPAMLASLIVIGRRWPFAGYLMLCFAAGLIGMSRPWRGGRW
jgi:hypothetical protein